jgi:hypothetical protein
MESRVIKKLNTKGDVSARNILQNDKSVTFFVETSNILVGPSPHLIGSLGLID